MTESFDSTNTRSSFKITMFGHKQIPSRSGGIEVVVGELSERLGERGHTVKVLNRAQRARDSAPALSTLHPNVNVEEVPTFQGRGLAAVTSSVSAAFRTLRSRPDVAHIHAIGPAVATPLLRLFRIPVVVTVHGLDWQRAKWGKFAKCYLKFGEWCAAKFANQVVVLTKSAQDYFLQKYGRKTVIIPNGLSFDSSPNPNEILEELNLRDSNFFLFVGRLVPEKEVHTLLDAFMLSGSEIKMVIAGAPSDSGTYYEDLVSRYGSHNKIQFTGFLPKETLSALYATCHTYFLPSRVEGMPLTLLEALSNGACCVISDIAENTEVTGEAALTFKTSNVDDLTQIIKKVSNEPALRLEYRERALQCAQNFPTWQQVTADTEQLYERTICA